MIKIEKYLIYLKLPNSSLCVKFSTILKSIFCNVIQKYFHIEQNLKS